MKLMETDEKKKEIDLIFEKTIILLLISPTAYKLMLKTIIILDRNKLISRILNLKMPFLTKNETSFKYMLTTRPYFSA